MNFFDALIEKILRHFAGVTFKDELEKAKKEFFGSANLLEDQSPNFDLRMSQFFDWYFFTRELSGYGRSPLEVCHLERELRFDGEEVARIENLKRHRHSLFELIKIKNDDVCIRDLFRNEKLWVRNSPWIYGFAPEEIFEARLIPDGETWVFTRGLCFHPAMASKYILEGIKQHRKEPDLNPQDFMLRLLRMRSKYDQYKHVRPEMIYSSESKLVT